ncbi:zinc finger protein 226-like [Ruditapes philippinarum]|uniref:zinc finger protein 226-like n=1 Tax=Ruditapes philippinarum TaxID=129788 RepID=UPI00295B0115|nr:zinc finger protein 226-like [Ruditapes philippinarum]
MVRHGEKSYRCHICSKGFYRIDELKHHIQNVHEAKSGNLHICDVCGKMYKNKSGLLVHHQYKHGNDPKNDLTCKVCDKMLSCRKKRMEHERRHVEGFKFTECDKCGRKFKNIEEHKWSCSQEPCTERHNCGDCGAMFLSQKYLQKHMKAKHGFSYTCVACGLTFSKKKAVMDHASNCYNVVFTEVLEESFT